MIALAAVCFACSVVMTMRGRKGLRRYHRIKGAPTVRVAEAPGAGVVEVRGRVFASEHGTVAAPFTGRHGVWVAVQVQQYRRSRRSGRWVSILEERHARPFWIDDGSGQPARIEPAGGELVVDLPEIASSDLARDLPPHLQQYLQQHGHDATDFFGSNNRIRFREYVLAAGDSIYALGCSRRVPGPPVHDGYRMQPTTQLVVFHGATERDELIVSTHSEQRLAAGLRRPFLVGVFCMVLSAVATVVLAVGARFELW